MDRSYRIKANVGQDQVLNVNLKQDVDLYEILSLTLKQENIYKIHSADYGVIVGRVLANDAFGVPNAKVSVFIPLSAEDKLRGGIRDIYPYQSATSVDKNNVKFNLLPNYKTFDCYQEVGSFPSKRLVLDDESVLEVFDNYYKYTTVTNNSGDYMIFGVPTGEQILHVDIDLSDVGILSQEPRDFIYKGYSPDLFESPTQFRKSTNLDSLVQLYNENTSVTVYPFWGDKNSNEIAITRKDIKIQYKFEPTCVFLGSIITDNDSVSMSHECIPDAELGEAYQLTSSKGNIEMIRKTLDGNVEEYQIKGTQLIDGDGTWCYQIPMNLDYIGTDEYGNIIPINDVNKGIPTRSRVRFRISLDEVGAENSNNHKARYLIPNNPGIEPNNLSETINNRRPRVDANIINKDDYYEFGSLTPDDCFRDLYWNKVYSIKNYIPRLQRNIFDNPENYFAIKGVNKKEAKKNNLLPYNRINVNLTFTSFYLLLKAINDSVHYNGDNNRWVFNDIGIYFISFWRKLKVNSVYYNDDSMIESIIEELDSIGLDFYNDWINGCLYFPSWHWYLVKKTGRNSYDSQFCECGKKIAPNAKLYLYNTSSLVYKNDDLQIDLSLALLNGRKMYYEEKYGDSTFKYKYTKMAFGSKSFNNGIIKKKKTIKNEDVYYYSFGTNLEDSQNSDGTYDYARLFSTDIILLGSLKDNDIDGVPKIPFNFPTTTSNIPPVGTYKPSDTNEDNEDVSFNGMHWGQRWGYMSTASGNNDRYKFVLGSGLFYGMYRFFESLFGGANYVACSDLKTVMNAERISELGVSLDKDVDLMKDINFTDEATLYMDGLITKKEMESVETRSFFASLNQNKLIGTVENKLTGYKKYDLKNMYPNNFDGRMEEIVSAYTTGYTSDVRNKDYLDFRFGSNSADSNGIAKERHFYGYNKAKDDVYHYVAENIYMDSQFPDTGYTYAFPLYDNSFYFYFGLNRGSTAIEKFYEQFYSECKDNEKYDFYMDLKIGNSGSSLKDIYVHVHGADRYTLELYYGDELLESKIITPEAGDSDFEGLKSGTYNVKAIDDKGNSISGCINLN